MKFEIYFFDVELMIESDLSIKRYKYLPIFLVFSAISFLHANVLAVFTMSFLSAAPTSRIMIIHSSRSLVNRSFQTSCESRGCFLVSLSLAWILMLFRRRRTRPLNNHFKWHLNYVHKDKYSASVGRQQCKKQLFFGRNIGVFSCSRICTCENIPGIFSLASQPGDVWFWE